MISGKFKGKKLSSVSGLKVRPTSDKLKAAIFNILFSLGRGPSLEGLTVLDVFAGSGSLGIEALSRDAKMCYFVDIYKDSVNAIKKNIATLPLGKESYKILKQDFKPAISYLSENKVKFDIILLDPPYKDNLSVEVIENINKCDIFNQGCVIVSEHSKNEVLPDEIMAFKKATEKSYGDKALSFFLVN